MLAKGAVVKKIFLVFLLLFFGLSGCSYKNTSLSIEPYKVNFLSFNSVNRSIFIDSIEDKRAHKNIVAVITNNNGDNLGYKTTQSDFVLWYKNALEKALKANGFKVAISKKSADLSIKLYIKKILVTFNKDILTKENLTGNISLILVIKEGKDTITKKISENISKYNGLTVSDETFTKEIKILLDDSIRLIVKNLLDNTIY